MRAPVLRLLGLIRRRNRSLAVLGEDQLSPATLDFCSWFILLLDDLALRHYSEAFHQSLNQVPAKFAHQLDQPSAHPYHPPND